MRHLSAPGCNAAPMFAERSDRELLSRFTAWEDEAAFDALVERYAPLVWSVSWHVLGHQQDAEDAFQQTFLVLMRKAASIDNGESLGSWLHSVAYRTAKDIRKRRSRHNKHECPRELAQLHDELEIVELLALVVAEVQRLPEKYRLPFALHYLEGKSETETAVELDLTKGKVASRLRKALEILRGKLARHCY